MKDRRRRERARKKDESTFSVSDDEAWLMMVGAVLARNSMAPERCLCRDSFCDWCLAVQSGSDYPVKYLPRYLPTLASLHCQGMPFCRLQHF